MRTGIEQARIELATWEAHVAEDEAALADAEYRAAVIRDRLAMSKRNADRLRHAVQQWDRLQTDHAARD